MAVELNQDNFKTNVQGALTLVDFWAPWCGPCRRMEPVLHELELQFKGRVKFAKVNVDQQQELARRYQVMGLPSYVLFREGKGTEKVTGVYSVEQLAHYLNRKLAEFSC
ncbi:Thioredoxin [Fructilactobacillus florum 8D]|uniref:Thioredoxin n=2 Tax=Fructilactobacillus florum TaxID=640331 RepID=W9EF33_9LACO|nr:thioredoxin [Fructilactobacillus florum]EKK21097.1 Thioredoxin [Fructilactobacillus florum 2F]ETO40687.1 Thioredoxin [Fructilactobacillus florum 8D]